MRLRPKTLKTTTVGNTDIAAVQIGPIYVLVESYWNTVDFSDSTTYFDTEEEMWEHFHYAVEFAAETTED